ncbi:MAG: site-specific DNA-methyltransferase [Bacteroidales bacterium]|nr:site-specific DNA-methyltransferase [Bacteroidales bacterium]
MIEYGHIYNEDCLKTMERMDNETIDFVITSPPYDNIRNYNGYTFDFENIVTQLFRVMKKGGVIIWVVADATIDGSETGTSFRQALKFMDEGFKLHDTMIYYKNNPMPQTGNRYHQMFEYMFCFSKSSPKTFNPIKEKTKYRGLANMKNRGTEGELHYERIERTTEKKVGNVFMYSIGGGISTKDKIAFKHPAIFPEKLVYDQILTWTNEYDIVYDPFMGSGTTAKMSELLHRKWIGSEISKEYVDIATERISMYKQNDLFAIS